MDYSYTLVVIGLWFGIAVLLAYLTYFNLASFLAWLLILDCFFVWSGLLPLWSLILLICMNIIYIGIKRYGSVI